MITILISIYKEPEEWITETFRSLESQTLDRKLYSYVVINDNPERNVEVRRLLEAVISDFDGRVQLILNSSNVGLTRSLNVGLEKCKTKYVARMDSDDISFPDRLEKQVSLMENNQEIDICFTKMTYINQSDEVLHEAWTPKNVDSILRNLERRNFIPHPSVMIRRASFLKNKIKYDESFIKAQDKALWLLCRDKGLVFGFIPESLIYYRLNSNSVSVTTSNSHLKRLINSSLFNGNNKLSLKLLRCNNVNGKFVLYVKSFIPKKIRFIINKIIFL